MGEIITKITFNGNEYDLEELFTNQVENLIAKVSTAIENASGEAKKELEKTLKALQEELDWRTEA